jgi:hypothetical protein
MREEREDAAHQRERHENRPDADGAERRGA